MVKTSWIWQLVAAISVTLASSLGAWHFSQPALSSVPSLGVPGSIYVGVKRDSALAPVRVDIDLSFYPSPDRTLFDMVLRGDNDAAVPPDQAGELMVGFCGAMKDVQLRKVSDGEELTVESRMIPIYWSAKVGLGASVFFPNENCVMTVIKPTDFTEVTFGEAGSGWAVSLAGETTAATEASAGSHHRYTFPSVETLTLPEALNSLDVQAVAAESMVRIQPRQLPVEYVPTISSPQVEDPTAPEWRLPIQGAYTTAGFQLSGVDQQDEMEVQRKLFLASAAAGTAGGGLIWVVGAISPVLNDLGQKRRNRDVPAAEQARDPAPSLGSRSDAVDPPNYLRLISAPVVLGIAGSSLAWLIRRRRR